MIQLDRSFSVGISRAVLLKVAARILVVCGVIALAGAVGIAAWDSYQGRISYLEDRVAALERKAAEPRPLFVVAEGYKGHIFVNGKEAKK